MSRSQAASLRDRVAIDGAKSSIQDVVCIAGTRSALATIAPIRTVASRCEWAFGSRGTGCHSLFVGIVLTAS